MARKQWTAGARPALGTRTQRRWDHSRAPQSAVPPHSLPDTGWERVLNNLCGCFNGAFWRIGTGTSRTFFRGHLVVETVHLSVYFERK